MDKKRERGKNFAENDKLLLLHILESFKHILENKKTDGETTKLKNECWESIARAFNACTQETYRTPMQLKTFYENHKAKMRRTLTAPDHTKEYCLSDREKAILLEVVAEHNDLISNVNSNDVENDVWELITTKFNNISATVERNQSYLYNFYKNYMQSSKRKLSTDTKEDDTDGIPYKKKSVPIVDEQFINTVKNQFIPPPQFDPSAFYFKHFIDDTNTDSSDVDDSSAQSNSKQDRGNGMRPLLKPADLYANLLNPNPFRLNLFKKEEYLEQQYKIKTDLMNLELKYKEKEYEEKLKLLLLERELKEKEVKLKDIEINIKLQELENRAKQK